VAIRAQAIVLPLPARAGGTVFGRTVETVLAERPCRVIIQADPEAARAKAPTVVTRAG
jgi:APA family basic amino acid/polyamine antiporter